MCKWMISEKILPATGETVTVQVDFHSFAATRVIGGWIRADNGKMVEGDAFRWRPPTHEDKHGLKPIGDI